MLHLKVIGIYVNIIKPGVGTRDGKVQQRYYTRLLPVCGNDI